MVPGFHLFRKRSRIAGLGHVTVYEPRAVAYVLTKRFQKLQNVGELPANLTSSLSLIHL